MTARIGYYCWAGPGTERMIKLKYFDPPIDRRSLFDSYNRPYLHAIRETFGVTDMWATYSWGFSDETERVDREFLRNRLPNFHAEGIAVHAYVQGPNVVYEEFAHRDWFCRDVRDQLIPYHRGRKLACLNHPEFRSFVARRVQQACALDVSGVYIDNPWLGQLGLPLGAERTAGYVGCRCAVCQESFKKRTGSRIPLARQDAELFCEYLLFRSECVTSFLRDLAAIAHAAGKQFGSNSLDPRMDVRFVTGVDLAAVNDVQDYLLFESLTLPHPHHERNNASVAALRASGIVRKPTFVVSYKRGIGFDEEWSQDDIDAVYAESRRLGFYPCLKGSEFVRGGTWHNLDPARFRAPQSVTFGPVVPVAKRRRPIREWMLLQVESRLNTFATLYWERAWIRRLFRSGEARLMHG